MIICTRCHKRMAVVFVTKIENNQKRGEGLCLHCAKELGLPIENLMSDALGKLGMTAEQLAEMEDEVNEMFSNGEVPLDENGNIVEGGAPTIDFQKLMEESAALQKNNADLPAEQEQKGKNGGSSKEKKSDKKDKKYKFLTTYCRNLTRAAAEGKLDRIVGRERELARVIQILSRRQKNNPCLIGEPGVGKTAIAEALSQRIVEETVPYRLKGKEVYLVDLTALVAGTQFRGQFESRILGLLNEVKEAGNVILVIDEVHNIVGAGDSEGSVNAANILKPALSRGEVQVIGATTLTEYRKYIEKDTALERRFQPVMVAEPSMDETVEMLRGIKHYYEKFHSIRIPDELLRQAVTLSERYITDRFLPDKAIDLLDEAAANLSLNCAELNKSAKIRDELISLKTEREACEAETVTDERLEQARYEKLAKIKEKELKLSTRLNEIEPLCEQVVLTSANLAEVIEIWTGVPASTVKEDEFERLENLETRLLKRIIGQNEAVSAVTRAIKRNRAGVSYKRKPVSFIFAGPTGVGKTELVKVLANDLFHSPETLIRLDMSEFMEKHSVSRIIGAPPGYVGYDEAGQLTEKIRRRPYSVILFDEIEKAHPDVLNILLQILDDGRITDAHGKTVNFENTVIVMTTNAGSDHSGSSAGFGESERQQAQAQTEKALSSFLRPEFLNRVDEILTFRSLDENDFVRIANIMLGELKDALCEKGLTLHVSEDAVAWIASHSYSRKFGARNMRRFIQTHIEDPLAEQIIADYHHKISQISISVQKNGESLKITCL
ncbi:MAG: ATP-dependent Clp protease ATP-binding subunit [Clostridia bacterium]|nr:ATP-dependent Clp protease ATP-binding subunit [Clostridia bacterium]